MKAAYEIHVGADVPEIEAEDLEVMEAEPVTATAIERHRGAASVVQHTGDLFGMVASYAERGITFPIESLERLIALQERAQETNARMSFLEALASFKAEVGPVPKRGKVVVPRNGVQEVRSTFAPLHVIAEHIREPLARHGLMYTWDSKIDGSDVEVFCTIHHIDGHSVTSSVRFPAGAAAAPGMNGVQAAGSARTYGERYSLVQALGLTTADVDDDAQGTDKAEQEKGAVITAAQAADVRALMQEVNADEKRFLAWLKVGRVEEIPAAALKEAISALEQKRRASA